MSDHDMDSIDASLRRQFGPPDLGDLNARIEEAAAAIGDEAPPAQGALDALNTRIATAAKEAEHDAPATPKPTEAAQARSANGGAALALALAAVAAIVLILSWPGESEVEPTIAAAPTSSQLAGKQLDSFLLGAAYPNPPGGADCTSEEPPPQHCAAPEGAAWLPTADDLRVVWECGGSTGIDCSAHDLPAERLMIVRVEPTGKDVIVCIERPSADPKPELPTDTRYNLFRQTLGEFVLYEVTPFDQPRVMPRFTI